jgi:putative restriction endonuclease
MAKGVLLHREDSGYKDSWDAYHFPGNYLSRVEQLVGDWVVFMEPVKAGKRGYYAVARLKGIRPDTVNPNHYYADVDTPTYLDFANAVPFQTSGTHPENSILNAQGRMSGKARSAVRIIPIADFNRIVVRGVGLETRELPRNEDSASTSTFHDTLIPFEVEQDRSKALVERTVRDSAFRTLILKTYGKRCAFTGFQWINGGGRAEVQAAHIKPVELNGPDSVRNGLALSGTVHWMFDRGLLSLKDDGRILVSNHINDIEGVKKLLLPQGLAALPRDRASQPHPHFLDWHRTERFKGKAVDL